MASASFLPFCSFWSSGAAHWHGGDRFIASGNGFTPGEEVTAESQYSERVIQSLRKIGDLSMIG